MIIDPELRRLPDHTIRADWRMDEDTQAIRKTIELDMDRVEKSGIKTFEGKPYRYKRRFRESEGKIVGSLYIIPT